MYVCMYVCIHVYIYIYIYIYTYVYISNADSRCFSDFLYARSSLHRLSIVLSLNRLVNPSSYVFVYSAVVMSLTFARKYAPNPLAEVHCVREWLSRTRPNSSSLNPAASSLNRRHSVRFRTGIPASVGQVRIHEQPGVAQSGPAVGKPSVESLTPPPPTSYSNCSA